LFVAAGVASYSADKLRIPYTDQLVKKCSLPEDEKETLTCHCGFKLLHTLKTIEKIVSTPSRRGKKKVMLFNHTLKHM
jgi:hypothetical protein